MTATVNTLVLDLRALGPLSSLIQMKLVAVELFCTSPQMKMSQTTYPCHLGLNLLWLRKPSITLLFVIVPTFWFSCRAETYCNFSLCYNLSYWCP